MLRFPLHRKQGPCPAAPAPAWHPGRPSLPQRRRPRALPLHSYHFPSHPSLHAASPSNTMVEKWCQPAPLGAFAGRGQGWKVFLLAPIQSSSPHTPPHQSQMPSEIPPGWSKTPQCPPSRVTEKLQNFFKRPNPKLPRRVVSPWYLPGGPVIKTSCFHRRGHEFDYQSGN